MKTIAWRGPLGFIILSAAPLLGKVSFNSGLARSLPGEACWFHYPQRGASPKAPLLRKVSCNPGPVGSLYGEAR